MMDAIRGCLFSPHTEGLLKICGHWVSMDQMSPVSPQYAPAMYKSYTVWFEFRDAVSNIWHVVF